MNTLRRFLSWSYKNSNDRRRLDLRSRMNDIIMRDRELDGTWRILGYYVKYGGFGYNCYMSEKPLWWVSKVKEEN